MGVFDASAFGDVDIATVLAASGASAWEKEEDDDAAAREETDVDAGSSPRTTAAAAIPPRLQASIFVVDCSLDSRHTAERLFERAEQVGPATTAWRETIGGIIDVQRARIVASQFDRLGVVLFGVEAGPAAADLFEGSKKVGLGSDDEDGRSGGKTFSGVLDYIPLSAISARSIQRMELLRGLTYSQFRTAFRAPEKAAQLSDLFWHLHRTFNRHSNKKRYSHQVFLLTPDDNPHMTAQQRVSAIQRGKDLLGDGVALEVVPVAAAPPAAASEASSADQAPTWSFSHFYINFLDPASRRLTEAQLAECRITLDQLKPVFKKREMQQRALTTVQFIAPGGIEIPLTVYTSVMEQKPLAPFFLHEESHKPLKAQTQRLCEETGTVLAAEQIRKYHAIGGERLYVEPEVRAAAARFGSATGEPQLLLLGFRAVATLKRNHVGSHATFLHPTRAPRGAAVFASSLLAAMEERSVYALCRYTARRNAAPRLCALLAQFEEVNEVGEQIRPPGFHLVPLPFAEDIRPLAMGDDYRAQRPTPKQLALATDDFLEKLRLVRFDPQLIPNPAIQFQLRGIEAAALGRDEPEPFTDATELPEVEAERLAVAAQDWNDVVRATVGDVGESGGGGRRPTSSRSGRPKTGAGAVASPSDQSTVAETKAMFQTGQLAKMTVPQLKAFLAVAGLPVSGKKANLIERVSAHFEGQTRGN